MSDLFPPQPAGASRFLNWLPSLLFVTLVVLAWFAPREPDVVVYGGTPQGVTAALAASRQGLRVTLVVPGPQLGGVLVRGWLATLDDTDDASHHSLYAACTPASTGAWDRPAALTWSRPNRCSGRCCVARASTSG